MPAWKKWVKTIFGITGAAIGGGIAISPTFRGLRRVATGDVQGGFTTVLDDMTGVNPSVGNFTPDPGKLFGTAVTVLAGVGIISLFRYVARRI